MRNLEREIGYVCRKLARKVVQSGPEGAKEFAETVKDESLEGLLGVAKFRDSEVHQKSEVGLVTGLAWTSVGGDYFAD